MISIRFHVVNQSGVFKGLWVLFRDKGRGIEVVFLKCLFGVVPDFKKMTRLTTCENGSRDS